MIRRRVLGVIVVMLVASSVSGGGTAGATSHPDDPYFPKQWGLPRIAAANAWSVANGTGAVIAVVDTGVDFSHPDLNDKLIYYSDADFVEPNGTCTGNPKKGGRTCVQDGAQDKNGHGTHVAGIAAAETNNGIGVAGVAPGARILPVRVLDAEGSGTTEQVAKGIRYAADKGAHVINLSLGFLSGVGEVVSLLGELDPIHKAIQDAQSKGAVVVVAAGNDTVPLCAEPAATKGVLCVGATDGNDLRSWYSNGDATMMKNYLVAPGGAGSLLCEDDLDIWSTVPATGKYDCTGASASGRQFVSGYDTLAGTSMAAPFVSGVAGLLKSKGLSGERIVQCILTHADDLGTTGRDPVFGYGRLDAHGAVGCS